MILEVPLLEDRRSEGGIRSDESSGDFGASARKPERVEGRQGQHRRRTRRGRNETRNQPVNEGRLVDSGEVEGNRTRDEVLAVAKEGRSDVFEVIGGAGAKKGGGRSGSVERSQGR